MSDTAANNKRIAKNTIYLYARTLLVMCVSLYTSRVILQTLGAEDFGIYNLVAGITAALQFLNGTLADATQRYITFELGKGSTGSISKIFSTCLLLHFLLAVLVIILIEPIGLWFINNKLQIPDSRLGASMWVFQFMVIQLFVSFISVPYNALIIAHEKMSAFAMISLLDAFMKLGIAYSLFICKDLDRLIIYGALMLFAQLILQSIYIIYCKHTFKNVRHSFEIDRSLIKEMGGFASWTVIGNLAFVCVTQGLNLLLGVFFLPVINAARGIAVQVQTAVNTFVKNFQTAINPQITKTCASGQMEEMRALVFRSSRFSFFLIMLPVVPLLFEADFILRVWLTDVPEYTSVFLKIILLVSLVNCLGNPLAVASKATGNIKTFELCAASIKLLVLPIAYVGLKFGFSPISVFVVQLIIEIVALISNIFVTHRLISFSFGSYFNSVLSKIMIVAFLALIVPFIINTYMGDTWIRFLVLCSSSVIWSLILIVKFGLNSNELQFILSKLKRR